MHLLAHPIDTIKVRKIAKSRVHDAALFIANKTNDKSTYSGFIKGYLSIMVGNLGYITFL